jgi:hypothetical protein
MAEREPKPHGFRTTTIVDQLSDDVVDGGDMVSINGVPKAKDPSQQGRPKQSGMVMERRDGPRPGDQIEPNQRTEQN